MLGQEVCNPSSFRIKASLPNQALFSAVTNSINLVYNCVRDRESCTTSRAFFHSKSVASNYCSSAFLAYSDNRMKNNTVQRLSQITCAGMSSSAFCSQVTSPVDSFKSVFHFLFTIRVFPVCERNSRS